MFVAYPNCVVALGGPRCEALGVRQESQGAGTQVARREKYKAWAKSRGFRIGSFSAKGLRSGTLGFDAWGLIMMQARGLRLGARRACLRMCKSYWASSNPSPLTELTVQGLGLSLNCNIELCIQKVCNLSYLSATPRPHTINPSSFQPQILSP